MGVATMHRQERLHDLRPVPQGLAQVSAVTVPGAYDVAQGHDRASSLLADGATEEAVVVKHAHFGHIAGVVPEDHRFAHIGRQGRVQVAHAENPEAIATHLAGLRQGQQE
jgi:hypothetical protein